MTEQGLHELLENLNSNNNTDLIHSMPLTKNVFFAKVWLEEPSLSSRPSNKNGPDHFYFIKDEINTFIAVVFDMVYDLHWYVIPEKRKRGYLIRNMRETILPHIFSTRKEQHITIDKDKIGLNNFVNSEKVALLLGFKKVSNSKYLLSKKDYPKLPFENKYEGLSFDEMDSLRAKVFYASQILWTVQTELEMKYGNNELSKDLIKTKDKLSKYYWTIEDLWYEQSNKN